MTDSIAFKEWQVVCEALADGRQSILLRKGGIHEGRSGFSFAHDAFFLFPTRFHAQGDQVREGEVKVLPEWQPGDILRVTHHAEALWAVTLTDWEKVAALRSSSSTRRPPSGTASIGKARAWLPAASTSPWCGCANSPRLGNFPINPVMEDAAVGSLCRSRPPHGANPPLRYSMTRHSHASTRRSGQSEARLPRRVCMPGTLKPGHAQVAANP